MRIHSGVIWQGTLICIWITGIVGCTVGPNYQPPMSRQASALAGATLFTNVSTSTDQVWWRLFDDPELERWVLIASTNNLDLKIAEARLREARSLWSASRFDFAPTVRSENSYQSSTASGVALPNLFRGNRHNELYRAGFDASWEMDLWGRVRRSVEAARATVEAVRASRDDRLISVRAEVAANYCELRGIQMQLAVSRRNATNQADTLKLAEALRDGGEGTQFDVARARSLWNATQATIPPLEARLQQAMFRIAVLCGRSPSSIESEFASEQKIPRAQSDIEVGNVVDLIRRRPDIRAAERSLAAWTARIGVDVAELFPRVVFNGNLGLQANRLSDMGMAGADVSGFGPHISWAAFDVGRVRQRIRAANARAEGALAVYENTVLLALEETERSLANLSRERQRLSFLRESEMAASEAVELARQRYRDGISDFLSVLDAERTLLSLQEQLVTSETRTATSLIAVFKALASS